MTRRHPRKLDFETIIRIPELGVEHVSERNGERHAMGHCPCHDDKKRSLSLTEKPDGTVLAHCFAGCKQETVWRELYRLAGVQSARANLILPRQRQQARNADAPAHLTLEQYARAKGLDANLLREWGLTDTERGIAIPYLDTDGNQVATRYRLALDGENRFRWARGDTPTLYGLGRLPEWGDSDTVYLVEGETDTLTLWSAGLPALGVPGASVWRAEWWLHLTRFQRIVVIPDADEAGRQLVQKLAETCRPNLRERVEVLELPNGVKDANEWWLQLDADPERFRAELEALQSTPLYHFITPIESDKVINLPEVVDLAEGEPQPTQWLVRNLIPARHATNLYGDSGSCKSLLALYLALCVIEGKPFLGHEVRRQGKVLYVDLELDKETHKARWWATARGAGYATPPTGLSYVRLNGLFGNEGILLALIEQEQPVLVILDSFGKAVGDPLDPQRAIALYDFFDTLPVPVLVIDHIAKLTADTPAESTREYGTVYKRHYARSAIQVDKQGSEAGRVAIILRHQKSNFGEQVPEVPLTVEIENEGDLIREVRFVVGGQAVAQNAELFGRRGEVLRFLKENGEANSKAIAEGTGIPQPTVYRLLGLLERESLIEEVPDAYPKRYRLRGDFITLSPPIKADKLINCENEAGAATFSLSHPINPEKVRNCETAPETPSQPADESPDNPVREDSALTPAYTRARALYRPAGDIEAIIERLQRNPEYPLSEHEAERMRAVYALAESLGYPALELPDWNLAIDATRVDWVNALPVLAGTDALDDALRALLALQLEGDALVVQALAELGRPRYADLVQYVGRYGMTPYQLREILEQLAKEGRLAATADELGRPQEFYLRSAGEPAEATQRKTLRNGSDGSATAVQPSLL